MNGDGIIWATPAGTRTDFDNEFGKLVSAFVASYNGRQPIATWFSNRTKPLIEEEFLNHLPSEVRKEVHQLIQSI